MGCMKYSANQYNKMRQFVLINESQYPVGNGNLRELLDASSQLTIEKKQEKSRDKLHFRILKRY